MAVKIPKGKKKKWFPVIAPRLFRGQPVGEMHLYIPEQAFGRTMSVNLMNLTGDMKKQNSSIKLEITKGTEGKLYTEIVGYQIMPTAVKRMVRRRVSKIAMSFVSKTNDKKPIRIKPLILTRGTSKKSVQTKIRNTAKEAINEYIKNLRFEDLVREIISHKFQMTFKKQLTKIFPIRVFEIRMLDIIKKRTTQAEPEKQKTAEVKEPNEKLEKPKEEKKPVEPEKKEVKEEKTVKEKIEKSEEDKKEAPKKPEAKETPKKE